MNDTKTLSGAEILAVMDRAKAKQVGLYVKLTGPMAIEIRTAVAALVAENEALRDVLQTMVDYAESPDFEGAPSRAAHENAIAVLAGVAARASTTTGGSHDP